MNSETPSHYDSKESMPLTRTTATGIAESEDEGELMGA